MFNDMSLERQVNLSVRSKLEVHALSIISVLFHVRLRVFALQFLVSEVKGLHHSLSCVAFIFVSLFAVQMLVSKK